MSEKLTIGWHTTISPSIIGGLKSIEQVHSTCKSSYNIAAQIFLKSPMRACSCKFTKELLDKTLDYCRQNNIFIVVHGQYILNFIKKDIDWATQSLINDIEIVECISPCKTGVVIHMGKNTDKYSIDECIENFYHNIKIVLNSTKQCKSMIILETSTKTKNGNDIFYDISTFGKLTNYLKNNLTADEYDRIGYCIDTAHIFASGYDIRTRSGFNSFMELWNTRIGKLTVFHLNDSKVGLSCCRDLHEQIGKGFIYSEHRDGLQALLEYALKNSVPIILETAGEQTEEMTLIQSLI